MIDSGALHFFDYPDSVVARLGTGDQLAPPGQGLASFMFLFATNSFSSHIVLAYFYRTSTDSS